jgi:hypothetical protein
MLVMAGWRGLLDADGHNLRPGARPDAISEAERVIGLRFPGELRSLYLASDGVFDTGGQWWVIWPLAMLAAENTSRRQAGVLPAGLIAFGDDGTGNPFCMRPGYEDVGCWHPIDGRYQPLAANLAAFWQGWAGQTITT